MFTQLLFFCRFQQIRAVEADLLLALATGCSYLHGDPVPCDATAQTATYAGGISPIFEANGRACHASNVAATIGTGNKCGDGKSVKQYSAPALLGSIEHAPGHDPMPKDRARVSACDIEQIRAWMGASESANYPSTAIKRSFFLLLLVGLTALGPVQAQSKYLTKTGQIRFFSSAPIEDIEATNQQVAAVLDIGTGQLAFAVPIKGFVFKRNLMHEHFNENYLESDKFPNATFTGHFVGFEAATLATAGPHNVQVEGDLTIHGVTHHIQVSASVELKSGQLLAAATFPVASADYNIKIPWLVRDNIAKVVSVRVALTGDAVAATALRPAN